MLREVIEAQLREMGQPFLCAKLGMLTEEQLKTFASYLSPELLLAQRGALKKKSSEKELEPVKEAESASDRYRPLGIERITQGKVGSIILAGGVGSRLGASVPKALFPIGHTTLLDVLIQKISIARDFHRTKIPCALIVSQDNESLIAKHLKETDVQLIVQEEAPLMDENGDWVLREDGTLATAPDGNGAALHLLQKAGTLQKWKKAGIENLTIVPIDNPLADPVDPVLLGYHTAHPADVTAKVIYRNNENEKVGVFVRHKSRIEVCEYMELPEDRLPQSRFANIGQFAITLDFAEKVATEQFPWHAIYKFDPKTKRNLWKFERFIFDMLSYSHKTNLLHYPREDVYAPLKNMESLHAVQAAIDKLF